MNTELGLSIVAGVLMFVFLGWIYSLFMQRRSSKIRQERMRSVLDQLKASACCSVNMLEKEKEAALLRLKKSGPGVSLKVSLCKQSQSSTFNCLCSNDITKSFSLSVYTGSKPSSKKRSPTGTLLCRVSAPQLVSCVITRGIASWFRVEENGTVVFDGTIGICCGDLIIPDTSLLKGDIFEVKELSRVGVLE